MKASAEDATVGSAGRAEALSTGAARIAEWGALAYLLLLPLASWGAWAVFTRALLVGAAVAGVVSVVAIGEIRVPRTTVVSLFLLFLILSAVSALGSTDPVESGRAASKSLLRFIVVFLLVACAPAKTGRWRRVGGALALSGAVLSSACWWLFAAGARNPWGGLRGPEMDYNSVGMFLVPTTAFAVAMAASSAGRARFLWWAVTILTSSSLALTYSRIGWVAFAVLCALLWVTLAPARLVLAASALAAGFVFVAATPDLGAIAKVTDTTRFVVDPMAPPERWATKRVAWKDVITLNDRLQYAWKPALATVVKHPWMGSGYGTETFRRLAPAGAVRLTHEHNAVLAVALQSGLVTAGVYVALLVALALSLRRMLRGAGEELPLVVALLGAVIAEYLLHGIAEPTNNGRMGILFAALVALTASIASRTRGSVRLGLER